MDAYETSELQWNLGCYPDPILSLLSTSLLPELQDLTKLSSPRSLKSFWLYQPHSLQWFPLVEPEPLNFLQASGRLTTAHTI